MEKRFPCCVREAWDCGEYAPGPQALPAVEEADAGPWPLPLYPRLGFLSGDHQDFNRETLLPPCGFLSSDCPIHGSGLHSTLRRGPGLPACLPWPKASDPAGDTGPTRRVGRL